MKCDVNVNGSLSIVVSCVLNRFELSSYIGMLSFVLGIVCMCWLGIGFVK